MKLRRKVAALLAAVMAFSGLATFQVAASATSFTSPAMLAQDNITGPSTIVADVAVDGSWAFAAPVGFIWDDPIVEGGVWPYGFDFDLATGQIVWTHDAPNAGETDAFNVILLGSGVVGGQLVNLAHSVTVSAEVAPPLPQTFITARVDGGVAFLEFAAGFDLPASVTTLLVQTHAMTDTATIANSNVEFTANRITGTRTFILPATQLVRVAGAALGTIDRIAFRFTIDGATFYLTSGPGATITAEDLLSGVDFDNHATTTFAPGLAFPAPIIEDGGEDDGVVLPGDPGLLAFAGHLGAFRGHHGTYGTITVANNAWMNSNIVNPGAAEADQIRVGHSVAIINAAHTTAAGFAHRTIVLNLSGHHTGTAADGWASLTATGSATNFLGMSGFVPAPELGGARFVGVWRDGTNLFWGNDPNIPTSGGWLAIPYTLVRTNHTEMQLIYLPGDARTVAAPGYGFIYLPLMFRVGGNRAGVSLEFSENSQVLPGTAWPINAAGLGVNVTLGGSLSPHSVNAPMRPINLIERNPGAIVHNSSTGAAIIAADGSAGIFRVALPEDVAFANPAAINFNWIGVPAWSGGNAQGFREAPVGVVFNNAAALTNALNTTPWAGIPESFRVGLTEGTVGHLELARGNWIDALNRGQVPNAGYYTILREYEHIAFLTQPVHPHDRQELIIILGTQNATTRHIGVLAQLQIIGGASVTHRNHLFPSFNPVVARITGNGIATGNQDHTIASLVVPGINFTAGAVTALGGTAANAANAIQTIHSGRLYASTAISERTTVAGTPMGWAPAGNVLGNPTQGGQAIAGRSGLVRVQESVPMAVPMFMSYTFVLTDAQGNPIPQYARIAAVQVHTGANTSQNGIFGVWQNRVNDQLPLHTTRTNGTHITTVGQPADFEAGTAAGLSGNAMLTFDDVGHAVTVMGVSVNQAAAGTLDMNLRFWLSTSPEFSGRVYVTLMSPEGTPFIGQAFGGVTLDHLQPLPIATVLDTVNVTTGTVHHRIGTAILNIPDIVITETRPGALALQREITLSLTEHIGATQHFAGIQFWPIRVDRNIEVTGANNLIDRIGVTPITPVAASATDLRIASVSRTTPSTIRLHGLEARIPHDAPAANIALVVRGDAILTNDITSMNGTLVLSPTNVLPALGTHDVGFRRYGFAGIVKENYITVTAIGAVGQLPDVTVGFDFAPSGYVVVNGTQTRVVNTAGEGINTINRNDRIHLPIRFFTEVFGADVRFIEGVAGVRHGEIIVTLGGITVSFWEGTNQYQVHGQPLRFMSTQTFIEGQYGSAFVSLHYFEQAFADIGLNIHRGTASGIISTR